MKKLLFILTTLTLLSLSWGGALKAQTVTVCEGTEVNDFIPVYGYSGDTQGTTSEFVIPSTAEGMSSLVGKSITAMRFYVETSAGDAWTATFQVYMKEIDETTLSSTTGPGSCTVVYTGTLSATNSTMDITFDNGYTYGGGNLLIGTYISSSGNYESASFYGIEASNAAYLSGDWGGYSSGSKDFIPKITFTYEGPTSCAKPTGLTASLTPGDGSIATINWNENGTATAWVLEYGTASDFTGATSVNVSGTPTKNLIGLTAEATYYARVKAVCGGEESVWSAIIPFTPTDALTITVANETSENSYFPLYSYNQDYANHAEYIIPASDLASINGATINAIQLYASYNLITGTTQVYVMEVADETFSGTDFYGPTGATIVYEGALTISSTDGMLVTFTEGYDYNGGNLLIGFAKEITSGYASGTFYGQNVTGASISGYSSSGFDYITATQQDFIPMTTISYLPAASCKKPIILSCVPDKREVTINWTENNTSYFSWEIEYSTDPNFESDIFSPGFGYSSSGNTITATVSELTPATDYYVRVKTICDNVGDESVWSSVVPFTTLAACPAPTNVDVDNITDNSAEVEWEGDASNYNVRYRTAGQAEVIFFDDFESGLNQWTILHGDNATTPTGEYWDISNSSGLNFESHSGTYCASSWSWSGDEYQANNYLVTPQIELRGTLKFWVRTEAGYPDSYEVLLSTTGNTIDDFTEILQTMAPAPNNNEWNEVVIDLSNYSGNGYIAIHHDDYNQDYLLIDDFGVYGVDNPAGAWTTDNGVTSPYPISELDPKTIYQVEVQAVCGSEDGESTWTTTEFETPASCIAPSFGTDPVSNLTAHGATVTWEATGEEEAWQVKFQPTSVVDVDNVTFTDDNLIYTNTVNSGYLIADQDYVVYLRRVCNGTDYSDVVYTTFHTDVACPAPILETTGITNVTGHTANVAWTGFSQNESYVVSYRTATYIDPVLEDNFENGIGDWNRINCHSSTGITGTNHTPSGSQCFQFRYNSAPPQYLVSPELTGITEGAILKFYYKRYSSSYSEPFRVGTSNVLCSTAQEIEENFTFGDQITLSDMNWHLYSANIPAGTKYICIKYEANDHHHLYIDDVVIGNPVPAGAWQTVNPNPTTASTTITGLDPVTQYDVKVKGLCSDNTESTESEIRSFTTKVSCPAPTDLDTVGDPATTSVKLSWTANAGENEWTVYYKMTTDENYTDVPNVDENPYTVEGLTPGKDYQFYVVANCSATDTSEASEMKTFTTECAAIDALGFTEKFDNYETNTYTFFPNCWKRINTGSSYNTYPYIQNNNSNSYSTPKCLYFYSYGSSSSTNISNQYAVLPEMNGLAGKQITLMAKRGSDGSDECSFKLGLMTDNTDVSTFVEITNGTNPSLTTSYQEFTYNIPTNATAGYVAIMMERPNGTSYQYFYLYIDDIAISEAPTCLRPSAPTFESSTTTTATLSWINGEEGQTAWQIAYSTDANFTPDNGTIVNAAENPSTIEGLTAATTYYAYVRAICGETPSDWSNTYCQFDTKQNPAAIPYSTGFETTDDRSWKATNGNNGWYIGTAVNNGGEQSLYISNNEGSSNSYSTSSNPSVSYAYRLLNFAETGLYNFSFDWKCNGESSYDYLRAWVAPESATFTANKLPNGTEPNGTNLYGYISTTPNGWIDINPNTGKLNLKTTWNTISNLIEFTETGHYYIVMMWGNDDGGGSTPPASIDNVSIEYISCPDPTNFGSVASTAHTDTLSWNAGGDENAWLIAYSTESGFNPNEVTPVEVTSNPAAITGLNQNTPYYAYLRAYCGVGDSSTWVGPVDFTTLAGNAAPINVTVSGIETTSATVSWDTVETNVLHEYYELYISETSDAPTTETPATYNNINITSKYLDGLTPGTSYYVWVRDNCGTDGPSDWTALSGDYFTTVATCPPPTSLAVTPNSETAYGANITWTPGQDNNSYTVEYREVITSPVDIDITYDFEDGTQGWTTIDADGHGDAWSRNNESSYAHTGNYSMKATFNSSYAHQDYLVSPQITLGGSFSFYAKKSGSYNDYFRVYLSTTGNTNASDFTIELTEGNVLPSTTYSSDPYTFDLSSYSGTGYVAIVYTAAKDQGWLYIDDIHITAFIAGEYDQWQTVNNTITTPSYTFDELEPEKTYEARVKGICDNDESPYSNIVSFTTLEACPAPTALDTIGNPTTSSVVLKWTENGSATAWQICLNGNENDLTPVSLNDVTINEDTVSYTLLGLDDGTDYAVKVRANCGGTDGQSEWSDVIEFTTLENCPAPTTLTLSANSETAHGATISWTAGTGNDSYTVEYRESSILMEEKFEEQTTNSTPEGWTHIGNGSAVVSTNYHYSGQKGVYFSGAKSDNVLVIPQFGVEANTLKISFYTRPEGSTEYPGSFDVGYVTSLTDASTFQAVETYSYNEFNDSYLLKNVSMATAPDGAYIAFRHRSDRTNYYWFIDDVTVEKIVGDPWNEAENSLTETSYTFTELDPETSYQARVRAVCETYLSNPTNIVSFTTDIACHVPTALDVENVGATATVTVTWQGTAGSYNIDINGTVTNNVTSPYEFDVELSTDYTVMVQAYCESDGVSEWTSPVNFTTPDCLGGHTIEYTLNDSYGDGWTGNPISAIYVVEGCGNVIDTLTIEDNSSSTKSGTLSLCGDYYEFIWQAGRYPDECSFTFTEGGTTLFTKPSNATDGMILYTIGTQSCAKPTALTAGTPAADSVKLSWTSEASNWQICVNGDEDHLINVNQNPYSLNDLTPETGYTVKLRAVCDNEQSCWSDEITFTTKCDPITVDANHSFTENFDATTTFPPRCWDSVATYVSNSMYGWTRYIYDTHSGDGCAYSMYFNDVYLILPDLAIANETSNVLFTFWSRNTAVEDYNKNSVVLLDGDNETELWTPISPSTEWVADTINLSAYKGQTISLAFKYEGNEGAASHSWIVDDIQIAFEHFINTVVVTIDPATGGSVTGLNENGEYAQGSTAELTAVPAEHYHFVSWTIGDEEVTTNPINFTVTQDTTLTVNFALDSYEITASVDPANSGTVDGAGTYTHGESVTLTATANTGYTFTNWTKGGEEVSTNATYSFTAIEAGAYVAHFTLNSYEITASTNPIDGGTITGAGTYTHGQSVTLTATANTGYSFTNWTKVGVQEPVATSSTYTFTATEASEYVAHFTLNSYEITATTDPIAGGTITGAGTYTHGETVTLTATANTGYTFTNWTKGGEEVSTNATYSFTAIEAGAYMANFTLNNYDITASVDPANSGTVEGAGTYTHGESVTLTATANTGYTFTNWTKVGVQEPVATSSTYTFTATEASEYVAHFMLNSYEITATTDPIAGGTITGAGSYTHGETVTLTATANTGYTFTNWTKGGEEVSTNATYSFTATEAGAYVANFTLNNYDITASVDPANSGTVEGAGTYTHGESVTLTATANTGYSFTNWTKVGVQEPVATSPTYTFTATEASEYVAHFTLNSYEITATTDPIAGGTITGAGTYTHGETVTLTATATTGYTFTNWTKGGEEVSTNATYSFTATEAGAYVANFSLNSYEITVAANPTAGGTVNGGGTYTHGQSVTLTANPATGYAFVNWTKDNVLVSSNATYTFTATEAGEYVATFSQNTYTVNVSADPTNGGTVSGSGSYAHGQTATLNATANAGYTFTNWTKNGSVVSTNATYSFTVTGPVDYVAHFTLNSYTVSATANPTAGGSVTGTGTYNHGASATLTAIPATGYSFVNWTKNGNPVSTDASYSFTVTEAATFVANFSQNSYMITATASPAAGGSVNGAGSHTHGATANLVATANPGYTFTNWTKNGTVVSTNATHSFTVTEAADYVANFSQNVYAINASANPAAGGSVDGAGNYNYGATATLTANANEGYTFTNWTKNGTVVSTNATYTFTVEAAGAYVANFTLNSYAINASANPTAGGTITGAGTYNHGATANLKATPATGYTFTNWTKNGNVVSTNANYSFTVTEAATYVANFSQNSYEITTTANPTEGGTLTGAGTYTYGATATLTATANTGYTFTNWTKNGTVMSTNANYTITVTEAADYVANFSLNSYTISASVNPTAGGTVSGANTYNYGATATLIATANTGYTFANWTKNGVVVSTDASYSFTVTETAAYTANFTLNSYALTVAADPTEGGTVSGAGTYNHFGSATLNATPSTGYAFINWTKNGTVVSTDATYTFTVEAAGAYVAHFSQNSYAINAVVTPEGSGTVTGTGNYIHGATATLTATANEGYTFVNWTDGNTTVSTDAIYSFTVEGSKTLKANFSLNSYAISTTANPVAGGTVSGAGTYNHGTSVTLNATANEGYYFVNWTKNGTTVSTSTAYSVNVTEAADYVANFELYNYEITATANPTAGGTVTGAGTYDHGTSATLTATVNEGYDFVNWTLNGTEVSTNTTYSFTVTEAGSYVANFSLKSYDVTATANPAAGGTVTGAGTYDHGATATLTAIANEGYTFTNWTKNGTSVSTSATYTFTVAEAGSYVANFTLNSYNVTATANPTAGGTITGAGTYNHGATATLTATTNEGYDFVNWTKNGTEVSTNTTYSFTVTEAGSYVANFSLKSYDVTATANPTAGGTVTGAGTYDHGATATLTATPNENYLFTNWTLNGAVVSTEATYSFEVNGSKNLVANFTLMGVVATPTFSIASGLYNVAQQVTINCSTDGATIRYTTDGSNPTEQSTVFNPNQPIVTTDNGITTIKAIAMKDNMTSSDVATAVYRIVPKYNVIISDGIVNGTVTANPTSDTTGATITLTANPAEGYSFNNGWNVTNATTGLEINVVGNQFEMPASNVNVSANFILNSYAVTATANPAAGGSVTGTGTYNYNDVATLTASPAEGYSFSNWTSNGTVVSSDANYQFTVTRDSDLVANFTTNTYNVTLNTNGGTINSGNVTTYTYTEGATLPTDISKLGHSFGGWYDNANFNGNAITSISANETGDKTFWAKWTVNSYALTINYKYSNGTQAATTHTENVNYNTDYSVTSPAITGYTADQPVVSGTMGTEAVTVNVVYSINSYNLTVNYKYADGTPAATTHTESVNYNAAYSVTSPVITGYTASQATVSGTMGTEDVTVDVTYNINSYNLTINYKYSNGTQAVPTHTESVNYNVGYSVSSPAITGYTADQAVVSGTMGTADVTVNVVYNINSYALTINYKYSDGSPAAPTHNENVNYNTAYSVTSPTITGYTADQTVVSGTMGTEAVTVDVTYSINSYALTINYKYSNGTQAAPAHTENVNYNVTYSVTSPVLTGYTADQAVVSGTMGTEPVTVNVVYNINSYDLIINYKYADGSPAAFTYTESVNYNAAYSVPSPVITGYTATQAVVSGTMGTADVIVDVVYSINSYNLTINYKYADGTQAAPAHSESINYNVAYSVTSPVITGYTADQAVVSGTMGTADVTVNVVYNINSYNLTILYKYANGTTASTTHTESVNYNVAYSVASPRIDGYVASKTTVAGTMADNDLTVNVTYYQVTTNIVDATNCAGNGNGSITVTAPTGNFEYSLNGTNFQTSNIFNGLNANNYNLYIRPINDEYNYVGEWTVASVITMPIVSVASNDSVFCLNETIMLNGNGSSVGTEYSYAWSGPANYSSSEKNPASFIASNGNMSGTYTLTVTNTATQCASQKSLNIYVNDATNSNYVFTLSGFNAVGNVANGPAIVNIMRPVVTHFMDGIIENYTIDSVTLTNDALAEYTTVGEYPVTWTATDACGNTATCSIIVTITDTECPLVQDVDGNIYSTVKFGTTCWMNSNLKTTHYADGREITNVYKYYYQAYPNVDENVSIYGLLYDWYDAMDVTRPVRAARVQGICPDGWYLPNEDDFQQLNNIPVGDLRSTSYWLFNQGTNNSGFDLRPGGMYNHSTSRYENLHGNAYLWSAAEINSTEAHCHMADCHCYMIYDLIYNKLNAFSVRCVKGE